MKKKKRTMEERLYVAQLTASNSQQSPKIKKALAGYGYNEERLNRGLELFEEARRLYEEHKIKHAEKLESTINLKKARDKAHKQYMIHVKIARVALRADRAAKEKLALPGIRKKDFSDWLLQAKQFYAGALETPGIQEKLTLFNIGKQELQAGRALVEEAEAAASRQEMARADVREAARQRDLALGEMERWRKDLIAIARLALVDHPQLLEGLGVFQPS